MKKWLKLIALSMVTLALVGVLACVAESFIQRRRAEELLNIIANLKIGSMRTQALVQELKRFNRYQSTRESSGDRLLYDQFMFRNYGFALLHLAPAKDIWIQIDYDKNTVVAKSAHFAEEPNRGALIIEEADIGHPRLPNDPTGSAERKVVERGALSDPSYMLSVRDGVSVSASRRRMDWTIDLTCMTQVGPCGDFRKILRGAFE